MKGVDKMKLMWLNSLVGTFFLNLPDPFLCGRHRIQCIKEISDVSAAADYYMLPAMSFPVCFWTFAPFTSQAPWGSGDSC